MISAINFSRKKKDKKKLKLALPMLFIYSILKFGFSRQKLTCSRLMVLAKIRNEVTKTATLAGNCS